MDKNQNPDIGSFLHISSSFEDFENLISKRQYSIGKQLRKKGQIIVDENEIMKSQTQGNLPDVLLQYIDHLKSQGLSFNQELVEITIIENFGISLIAKKAIQKEIILAQIPYSVMMDSRSCCENDGIRQIIEENLEFFVPDGKLLVEDRVILISLLYEFQLGDKSKYFHMINNFSKDIDASCFFSAEELQLYDDKYLTYWSQQQLQFFEELAHIIQNILIPKYPQIFQDQQLINLEIVRWLYSHIVTRTFGLSSYVTFVPFAEFMNHGYISTFGQIKNASVSHQIQDQAQYEQSQISDDSYDSSENYSTGTQDLEEDYFSNSQIIENNYDLFTLSSNIISCIGVNEYNKYLVEIPQGSKMKIQSLIMNFINDFDLGQHLNSIIFSKIIQKLKKIEQKFSLNKKVLELDNNVEELLQMIDFLKFLVQNAYNQRNATQEHYNNKIFKGMKQDEEMWTVDKEQKVVFIDKNETQKKPSLIYQISEFESSIPYDQFSQKNEQDFSKSWFILKASPMSQYHQSIPKNAQLQYQYGRLSNRSLLNRYGFAMEWNKYDTYYIKIDTRDLISSISKEAYLYMNQFKVKFLQLFKLKYTELSYQLLSYCRSCLWNLELQSVESIFIPKNVKLEQDALKMMLQIIQKELNKWSDKKSNIIRVNNWIRSKIHLLDHQVCLVQTAIKTVQYFQNQPIKLQDLLKESDPKCLKILAKYIQELYKLIP